MPNPRKPFRINVGFIIHEETGYNHEIPFELDQIKLDDLELQNLTGSVMIGRTPQGLIVQGKFSADTKLECVRCLREFNFSLNWDITDLYAFNKKSVSESELLVPDDAHIDLAPLIREYALLEIPISPLHSPDCKGLCPECGEDLNIRDCGHRPEQSDSPFAKLKDLL
ncbi:MAG: YceD family protein [Anaerolineales bacterium]